MLAITGTTGKIGGAVLKALLDQNLFPRDQLIICTSSDPEDARWNSLKSKGAKVRQSDYNDPDSMARAFSGCSKLFLVSTPHIEMDFDNALQGREKHHIAAIMAAQEAGVEHIYYTSLAFGSDSNAGVMQAHLRTEAFLQGLNLKFTSIREGLYNESWPLYFGYYDIRNDGRKEVIVAGDGPINWTSIADLGLATALVVTDPTAKYEGSILYLSSPHSTTLKDIAKIVSKAKGEDITLKIVSRDESVKHYTEKGRERGSVEWWVSTYAALNENECLITDETFKDLLSARGKEAKPVEDSIIAMLNG